MYFLSKSTGTFQTMTSDSKIELLTLSALYVQVHSSFRSSERFKNSFNLFSLSKTPLLLIALKHFKKVQQTELQKCSLSHQVPFLPYFRLALYCLFLGCCESFAVKQAISRQGQILSSMHSLNKVPFAVVFSERPLAYFGMGQQVQ